MVNLYFDYTTQLLSKTQLMLEKSEYKKAMGLISKSFAHLDLLMKFPELRKDFPIKSIKKRHKEFLKLAQSLKVSVNR